MSAVLPSDVWLSARRNADVAHGTSLSRTQLSRFTRRATAVLREGRLRDASFRPEFRVLLCETPRGRFSIGSSKSEVASVQGAPTTYSPNYWQYGLATVMFHSDRISGWSNAGSLKVSLPGAGTRPQDRFSVGASTSDVAAVQGVPTSYAANYWQYGLATVMFDGGRVSGWSNARSLKLSLPGAGTRPQGRISVGVSKADRGCCPGRAHLLLHQVLAVRVGDSNVRRRPRLRFVKCGERAEG